MSPAVESRTRRAWSRWFFPVTLGLIVAAATALRFWELGAKPFWLDETFTYVNINKIPLSAQIQKQLFFIGYFLLQYVARLFGDSPFVFRFLSALASSLSVPLLAVIVRRVYGERAALLAAGFAAFAMVNVYYAQEARAYSLSALFALGMIWFWLRWFETTRRRYAAGFIAVAIYAETMMFFPTLVVMSALAVMLVQPNPDAPSNDWARRLRLNVSRYRMTWPTIAWVLATGAIVYSLVVFSSFISKLQGRVEWSNWGVIKELFAFFVFLILVLEIGQRLLWPSPSALHETPGRRVMRNLKQMGWVPCFLFLAGLSSFFGGFTSFSLPFDLLFRRIDPATAALPAWPGMTLAGGLAEQTRYLAGDGSFLLVVFLLGLTVGCRRWLPRDDEPWRAGTAWTLVALVAALGTFFFQLLTYRLGVRYLLVVYPLLIGLWAGGFDDLLIRLPRRFRQAAVVAVLLAVAGLNTPYLLAYYHSPIRWAPTNDEPRAFERMCRRIKPGDAVLSFDQSNFLARYYYARPCPDGTTAPQINVFVKSYLDHPDYRFTTLFGDDPVPEQAAILYADGPFDEVELPFTAERFWLVGFSFNQDQPPNDPLPWWRRKLEPEPPSKTYFPGGEVFREGAMVSAFIDNPSADPHVLVPQDIVNVFRQAYENQSADEPESE